MPNIKTLIGFVDQLNPIRHKLATNELKPMNELISKRDESFVNTPNKPHKWPHIITGKVNILSRSIKLGTVRIWLIHKLLEYFCKSRRIFRHSTKSITPKITIEMTFNIIIDLKIDIRVLLLDNIPIWFPNLFSNVLSFVELNLSSILFELRSKRF